LRAARTLAKASQRGKFTPQRNMRDAAMPRARRANGADFFGARDRYPQKLWISLWIFPEQLKKRVLHCPQSRRRSKFEQYFVQPIQRVTK
jgi:hypothetical protein